MATKKCWEIRGCDPDMEGKCAFGVSNEPCKISCYFTVCPGDKYEVITDFSEHPFDLDLAEYGVAKQQCASCRIFIRYAKKVSDQER